MSEAALSRRRLLSVMVVGAAATAAPVSGLLDGLTAEVAAAASCGSDTDEQEVGPFYVAEGIVRSDIAVGEDGIAHTFTVTVTDSETCSPVAGAAVDVWHANASGVYSDESSEGTVGETYCRGVQITDAGGQVTFTSIFPGWYSGRANHVHLRVYTGGTVSGSRYDYSGATLIWTGQMFFDPDIDDAVAAQAPYSPNPVARTTNAQDRVYTQQNGAEVLATTTGNSIDGYTSTASYTVTGTGTTSGTDSTSLSLIPSASSLVCGKPLTLSGVLLDTTTSGGLSDRTVSLTATLPSGKTLTTKTTTGSGGSWSVTFWPAVTATYRASFAATSGYAAASSSAHTVVVHYKVAVTHVSSTASATKAVSVRGTITPAKSGRRVTLHRIGNGTEHTILHVRTNSHGVWKAHFHLHKGNDELIATVPASTNLAAGRSRTLTIRRSSG